MVSKNNGRVPAFEEGDPEGFPAPGPALATMSDSDFFRLSRLIQDHCGIKLPAVKKIMLEGRLRKRLNALGMRSFSEYFEHLFDSKNAGGEYVHMLDAVTTNKTDFFRESEHFDYLLNIALPELVSSQRLGVGKPLHVWSAGCSTGEEPYTLAMVLSEFADKVPHFHFSVLGTDISTKVLAKALSGTYGHETVDPVPMSFRKKYLLRSKSNSVGLVRIRPELRASVRFERLNLMEKDYGLQEQMAIIFCRNVIIYFDRPTQETVLERLCNQLVSGGYLFMGHSESIHNMNLHLFQVATTIHRKV